MATGITVSLGAPHTLTVVAAQTLTTSTITVLRWVDRPSDKIVLCFTKELREPVTLWSGADYDSIGEWTTAQAEAQLTALVNAM